MSYATNAPARKEVDAMSGPAVLEFGTNWCG
jgi:thioredoxin 1